MVGSAEIDPVEVTGRRRGDFPGRAADRQADVDLSRLGHIAVVQRPVSLVRDICAVRQELERRFGRLLVCGYVDQYAPLRECLETDGLVVARLQVGGIRCRVRDAPVRETVFGSRLVPENDQSVLPAAVKDRPPVSVPVHDAEAPFHIVVEKDPVEAFELFPAGDPVVRPVGERVFESGRYFLDRTVDYALPVFPEAVVAVVDPGDRRAALRPVRVGRIHEIADRRDGGQRIGIDPSEPVGRGRSVAEAPGQEAHSLLERLGLLLRITAAHVERSERRAVHEVGADRIPSCGRDRVDERADVQERMVVREGQHPYGRLDAARRHAERVPQYRKEAHRLLPCPTVAHHAFGNRLLERNVDFVEHVLACQAHPLLAGSDDLQQIGAASGLALVSDQAGRSLDDGESVRFDTGRMRLLVEQLGSVDPVRVAQQRPVAGGRRETDRFAVAGAVRLDFRDRRDGQRDRDGRMLVRVRLAVVDKDAYHRYRF